MMKSDDRKNPVHDPRAERLAAALRDNLKRRKAQARGRAEDKPAGTPEGGVESEPGQD